MVSIEVAGAAVFEVALAVGYWVVLMSEDAFDFSLAVVFDCSLAVVVAAATVAGEIFEQWCFVSMARAAVAVILLDLVHRCFFPMCYCYLLT